MKNNLVSLIDFLQQIQWFMTKSRDSMATRDILYTCMTIDRSTLLDVVVKRILHYYL